MNYRFQNRAYLVYGETRELENILKATELGVVMADYLRPSTLFRSSLIAIYDKDCHAPRGCLSSEEQSISHSLVFPRSGVFIKKVSNKDQVVAESTRVLFFNRHETYRVSHPIAGGDTCTAIHFDEEALVDFLRSMDPFVAESPGRPFRSVTAASSAYLALRLQRLRRFLLSHRQIDPLVVEEICALLLQASVARVYERRSMTRQPIGRATRQAHRDLVDATRVVLARRFRDRLSLGDIARAVFSSPFHLARVFRRETGTSLHRQLNRLRLRLALEHLVNSRPDLTMLAFELGFSSHAHFTQAFRSEFGCAPSEFSRQLSMRGLRGRPCVFKSTHAMNGNRQHHR
jgi:AraC-like DNA-binding protein